MWRWIYPIPARIKLKLNFQLLFVRWLDATHRPDEKFQLLYGRGLDAIYLSKSERTHAVVLHRPPPDFAHLLGPLFIASRRQPIFLHYDGQECAEAESRYCTSLELLEALMSSQNPIYRMTLFSKARPAWKRFAWYNLSFASGWKFSPAQRLASTNMQWSSLSLPSMSS